MNAPWSHSEFQLSTPLHRPFRSRPPRLAIRGIVIGVPVSIALWAIMLAPLWM